MIKYVIDNLKQTVEEQPVELHARLSIANGALRLQFQDSEDCWWSALEFCEDGNAYLNEGLPNELGPRLTGGGKLAIQ